MLSYTMDSNIIKLNLSLLLILDHHSCCKSSLAPAAFLQKSRRYSTDVAVKGNHRLLCLKTDSTVQHVYIG